MERLYWDRDWLWEHYIVHKESMLIMAKKAKCNPTTICDWLHKLSIPTRKYNYKEKICCNRDWLYEHYVVWEEPMPAMAKEAGCSEATIRRWLHKYGIPVRDRGEASFLANRNSVTVTPDLLEFLRGEILGDGCVSMPGNRSALYKHSSAHERYLIWLSGDLDEWGIKQSGQINRYEDKHGAVYYYYTSKSYPELAPIYKRWYPNDKKTVPQDLKLTSIMARQWYLGDGGLTSYKIKRPGIKLCTCGFDKQSVDHLIKELNRLGFKATHQPSTNSIYIWVHSVQDFLSWIGPCPISCYDYKWAI